MRAIFIFVILTIFLVAGCASVEVAKEVTKASKKLEKSVKKILTPQSKQDQKDEPIILIEEEEVSNNKTEEKILIEKEEIFKEQKNISVIVMQQKTIFTVNLYKKNMQELNQLIGQPRLIRRDRNTTTARFDSKNCRLFVFMDANSNNPLVEYYELRNGLGELIDNKKNIELCFKEIKVG